MTLWSKNERRVVALFAVFALFTLAAPGASAMHIMEGYLPAAMCAVWGIACLPFLAAGVVGMRRTIRDHRKTVLLLAMSGAFIFVISSLKIPSLTGSCSHMTGTGLAAILFGPFQVSVLGVIVLLFQALLLAHGGLTSLGANTFSMAIAGPIFTWVLYKLGCKAKLNRKVVIFAAAALGDLFTYCVTSIQLAVAYPDAVGGVAASAVKFLGVFAPTQLPLAIIEGILTVIIIIGMEAYAKPELREIGYLKEGA